MEIGIWLERKLVILLGKYLTAGRGVEADGMTRSINSATELKVLMKLSY